MNEKVDAVFLPFQESVKICPCKECFLNFVKKQKKQLSFKVLFTVLHSFPNVSHPVMQLFLKKLF